MKLWNDLCGCKRTYNTSKQNPEPKRGVEQEQQYRVRRYNWKSKIRLEYSNVLCGSRTEKVVDAGDAIRAELRRHEQMLLNEVAARREEADRIELQVCTTLALQSCKSASSGSWVIMGGAGRVFDTRRFLRARPYTYILCTF